MKLFHNLLWMQDPERHSAAFNMAMDECLLFSSSQPVLRTYGWTAPSISFGYFTPWRDVVSYEPTRDLVRRWTGGGIVEHGEDFTYSLVLPGYKEGAITVYREVHTRLAELLSAHGLQVELVRVAEDNGSSHCFARAAASDLRSGGRKIAGAAMRRHRHGLLFQGSLQGISLRAQFARQFAGALNASPQPDCISPAVYERAARIEREKYSTLAWNRKF